MGFEESRKAFEDGGLFVTDGGRVFGGGRSFGMLSVWDGSFHADDGTIYGDVREAVLSDGGTITIGSGASMATVTGKPMSKDDKRFLPNGGRMPSSISALEDMFPLLYPDAESQVYMDELSERPYIDMAMFGQDSDGFVPVTDKIIPVYHADIERRLDGMGLEGKYPPYKIRDEMLDILVGRTQRNLFREWVESHEWDGVPRVRTWFQDTFGATAPAFSSEPEKEDRYLGDVSEAWFIGGVRRMYMETKHEIVPVLTGGQGIMKGTAIQYTAGRDEWYVENTEDIKNTAKFLDSTRGRVIVELSEATQIRGPDVESLKAFISKSEDQLRKPYAHFEESYPRHFILIASTNLDNIFTDITGNRRFFPMYCDPDRATREFSVDRTVGQYDVEQVWAEALHMFRNGHRWYLTSATAELARVMQEFYTQENSNVSVIDDWLDDPVNHFDKVGTLVSKADIMNRIFAVPPDALPPKDVETAYRAWTNGTTSWKKVPSPVRINGKSVRAYKRVKAPDAPAGPSKRLKVVEGATASSGTPEERLRAQAQADGLVSGMRFKPRGMTEEMLESLCYEGYIYYMTSEDGSRQWYFGDMPS